MKGIVFNVQRYTINDGPGIRTEIFLKGCPFKCDWCSNPESQNLAIEPGVYPSRCITEEKCGLCIRDCENQALLFGNEGIVGIDRNKCVKCMRCAQSCPSEAIRAWGQQMSVEELMLIVKRDCKFYEKSSGGITLSGGEVLVQKEFALEILKASKADGIHTCMESTLHGNFEDISKLLEYTDILISDIKTMDEDVHLRYCGQGNRLVLENLVKAAKMGQEMILRIPVIPGINDDEKNIEETANFITQNIGSNLRVLQLLSFMHMGEEKCASLDRKYKMKGLKFDRDEFQKRVEEIAGYFNTRGIRCTVGTKEEK